MEWQISNQPLQGALGSSSQFEVLPHPAFITWESWFRFFRLPIMPQHFDQNYWCVKVIKSKGTMCDILPNCSPFTIWGPDKAQPLPFGWEICLLCIAHLTVPEWDLSCTMIELSLVPAWSTKHWLNIRWERRKVGISALWGREWLSTWAGVHGFSRKHGAGWQQKVGRGCTSLSYTLPHL